MFIILHLPCKFNTKHNVTTNMKNEHYPQNHLYPEMLYDFRYHTQIYPGISRSEIWIKHRLQDDFKSENIYFEEKGLLFNKKKEKLF